MTEIAVIDDGVNSEYFPLIGRLSFDLYIKKGTLISRKRYNKKKNSHGTVCAAIIKKYAPQSIIGSIKVISDNTQRGRASDLVIALRYCYENKNIKVVHMSLGSRESKDLDIINKAVSQLIDDNRIVVAALTNTMKYSTPACTNMVFGVKTDTILQNGDYYVNQCGLCDVSLVASSNHQLINYMNEIYFTPNCNSYAAPVITAKISNVLDGENHLNTRDLAAFFKIDFTKAFKDKILLTQLETRKCNIPIIAIQAKNAVNFTGFAKLLSEKMLEKGYPCKTISVIQNPDYEHNIEADMDNCSGILNHIELESLLAFYEDKMEISSILFITDDFDFMEYDIKIMFSCGQADISSRRNSGYRNKYCDDTITVPQKFTLSSVINAIRYIEKQGDDG